MRFSRSLRFRGQPVSLDLDPARIAGRNPELRVVRDRMLRGADGDVARVDSFLAGRIGDTLARFGDAYLIEVSARLDRIATARDTLTDIYDSVIRGEIVRPDVVRQVDGLLSGLATDMNGLISPRQALENTPRLTLPAIADVTPVSATPDPVRSAVVSTAVAGRTADLDGLPPERRAAVTAAAELAPDAVRRVVLSDTAQGLNRTWAELDAELAARGMSRAERARVIAGLRDLNRQRRAEAVEPTAAANQARLQQRLADLADPDTMQSAVDQRLADLAEREARARGRGRHQYANDLRRQAGRLRAWLVGGGTRGRGRELRVEVERSDYLKDLVANLGGGPMLQRLWVEYQRRRERRDPPSFEDYVRRRMSQFRGQRGETGVAFSAGNRFTFLKAPDDLVTLRGTDLVAVDRRTGELLIIDNKALNQAEVSDVSALTRNLLTNLRQDVADFKQQYAGRTDFPLELQNGVARLERALAEIDAALARPSLLGKSINDPDVQAEISRILGDHGIRRVVTGEGGLVEQVSADLQAIGIGFLDLDFEDE